MSPLNDGSRPSRLELGRRHAGEVPGDLDAAYARAVAACSVEPFDMVALRARAERLDDRPPPVAVRPRPWWLLLPTLAALAAAVLLALPAPAPNHLKGGVDLDFYVLRGGQPMLGDLGAAHHAGDRLQFSYLAGGYDRVILLSVDGTGSTTVYFPADGGEPVPAYGGGRHVLDASIILDTAPGPEVFVALFGAWTVASARDLVEDAFADGGPQAVTHLGDADPSITSITVEKE